VHLSCAYLIDAHESDHVACAHGSDALHIRAHHQTCALNALQRQVILLTRPVVWTLEAHLLASIDCTSGQTLKKPSEQHGTMNNKQLGALTSAREDTSESVEALLVRGGHHLAHVQHQGAVRIAVADGLCDLVILRAGVQILAAVLHNSKKHGQTRKRR